LSDKLSFAPLSGGDAGETVQIISRRGGTAAGDEAFAILRTLKAQSAVSVTGVLQRKYESKSQKNGGEKLDKDKAGINQVEINLESVKCLNSFPDDITVPQEFGPEARHLQIRFDTELTRRLQFRSIVATCARSELQDFQEIETPILFKSTPEGANEFLVPTRRLGYAYALPQSPQQYKQILMASGINRYVQFAKCFRDEDLRADRQPEFTQIDLEMAWTDGEGVMQRVERFMKSLYKRLQQRGALTGTPLSDVPFLRMTYDEAMSKHGSDKPDLRIRDLVRNSS